MIKSRKADKVRKMDRDRIKAEKLLIDPIAIRMFEASMSEYYKGQEKTGEITN